VAETLLFRISQGDVVLLDPADAGAEAIHLAIIDAETGTSEETANPILPTGNELFYGALLFLTLWALMKFVLLPPITKVQDGRNERIRTDREAAEQARTEARRLEEDYKEQLARVRTEATRIIDDARHTAEGERTSAMAAVDAEIADQRAQANAEVEATKAAALEELKSGVAGLAVDAAQRVVQTDIDAAAQRPLIDDYVNRTGAHG
jgi:F-type H+-transporting ATPase subunit b